MGWSFLGRSRGACSVAFDEAQGTDKGWRNEDKYKVPSSEKVIEDITAIEADGEDDLDL